MPPLDDELRTALARRASSLEPSADPMAGIERRARGLRRTRLAASVAGTALAVSAVAIGAVALQPGASSAPPPPDQVATAPLASYVLDPAAPWPFRGDDRVLQGGAMEAVEQVWREDHPGAVLTPLFGLQDPSSQYLEVAFVASSPAGDRTGYAQLTEDGPVITTDSSLEGNTALVASLPDGRVVVVADPRTTVELVGPPAALRTAPQEQGPGTLVVTRPGPGRTDIAVTAPDGSQLLDLSVQGRDEEPEPEVAGDAASYGLDLQAPWAFRGDPAVADALRADAEALFGAARGPSTTSDLYAAASDGGVSYLVQLRSDEDGVTVVSTTTQRGDRAPEQTLTPVEQGQALLQLTFENDLDDASTYLVLLADPRSVLEVEVDGFPFIAGEGVFLDGARLPGAETRATLTTQTGETYLEVPVP